MTEQTTSAQPSVQPAQEQKEDVNLAVAHAGGASPASEDALLPVQAVGVRAEAQQDYALGYATRLAEATWRKHYRHDAPDWKPFDDLVGVLAQIDNMLTGLMKKADASDPVPFAWYEVRDICDRDGTPIGRDEPRFEWGAEPPEETGWYPLYAEVAAPAALQGDALDAAPTLAQQLQQKCSDWKAYWRASDAHGVELTHAQALELLRDALGVEVEFKASEVEATQSPAAPERSERVALRKQITDLERIKHDLEGRLFDALKTDKWLAEGLAEVDHAENLSRGVYSRVLDVACVAVARVKELESAAPAQAVVTDEQIEELAKANGFGFFGKWMLYQGDRAALLAFARSLLQAAQPCTMGGETAAGVPERVMSPDSKGNNTNGGRQK